MSRKIESNQFNSFLKIINIVVQLISDFTLVDYFILLEFIYLNSEEEILSNIK